MNNKGRTIWKFFFILVTTKTIQESSCHMQQILNSSFFHTPEEWMLFWHYEISVAKWLCYEKDEWSLYHGQILSFMYKRNIPG